MTARSALYRMAALLRDDRAARRSEKAKAEREFLNWAELRYPDEMGVAVTIPSALWTGTAEIRQWISNLQVQYPSVHVVTLSSRRLVRRVAEDRAAFDLDVPGWDHVGRTTRTVLRRVGL